MEALKNAFFTYIDEHREDMISLWADLVNQDSQASDPDGVAHVARRLMTEISSVGGEISWNQEGNALTAYIPGNDKAPVFLLGHMDTVFPKGEAEKRPFTIKDGKAYGPGVLDMKGGLTVMMWALKGLAHVGFRGRPIKIVLAADEETAHGGSMAPVVIEKEAAGCVAAFNCETSYEDNSLVLGRKGGVVFKFAVHGVAAHAGNNPEVGRNAIWEMAQKIDDIQRLTDWDKGITYSIGTIRGGTVSNAIPNYCEVEGDIRFLDPALSLPVREALDRVLQKTYIEGTRTELLVYREGMIPMKRTEGNEKLFALVKETAEENGMKISEGKLVGGGSDSGYVVAAGVPTVCAMGVKGKWNHTKDEYALVDSLFERAKLLGAVLMKLDEKSF